ncbi:NEDD8-conjugating enzyme Ubc12 [Gossypium australe]|uniref:NEDD8-conjugating enzyme Ubc12 n=1 Tax=Gossypium australe TaxID=47621 RepID=A0A5B6W301_9ROSI|nr:NEDD8-conjugating enzyme Ubc12 [Gossypium australe]
MRDIICKELCSFQFTGKEMLFYIHSFLLLITQTSIQLTGCHFCSGGTFLFSFQVSPIYPHEAPKVKCKTKVYHPNIDLEGNVCLNILREDWKPVLNINTVIYGLYHLFTEPNYEDPLNHDAAAVLRDNPKMFESNVKRAMYGGYVGQTYFPRIMLFLVWVGRFKAEVFFGSKDDRIF